jgi:hypothetical protein
MRRFLETWDPMSSIFRSCHIPLAGFRAVGKGAHIYVEKPFGGERGRTTDAGTRLGRSGLRRTSIALRGPALEALKRMEMIVDTLESYCAFRPVRRL